MTNEQHVDRNQCIKKSRASCVLLWLVEVRLRVLQSVIRQLWGWVGVMLLLIVSIPLHLILLLLIRLVVFSIMASCSSIHAQPTPLDHAAALTNAPAPSSVHLVPTKMKTIRLRAKRVVPIHTVFLANPVVTTLLPRVQ